MLFANKYGWDRSYTCWIHILYDIHMHNILKKIKSTLLVRWYCFIECTFYDYIYWTNKKREKLKCKNCSQYLQNKRTREKRRQVTNALYLFHFTKRRKYLFILLIYCSIALKWILFLRVHCCPLHTLFMHNRLFNLYFGEYRMNVIVGS